MLGAEGEVWTIVVDEKDNIYIGTKNGNGFGNVYRCLANQNSFKIMPGLNKCVSSLTFDNKGNLYAGVFTGDSRKEARNGNVYKCLAEEKAFKPMWGIKDGDGVISLIYEENKNILYATTWNGRDKMDARDGALYEYSLAEEDDVFVLLKRDLAAIWHLEIRDGAPFIDAEYYLDINRKMKWV